MSSQFPAQIDNSITLPPAIDSLTPVAGDLSGTAADATVVSIRNNAVQSGILGVAQDGYVLTWTNNASYWYPAPRSGNTQIKNTTYFILVTDGDIFADLSSTSWTLYLPAIPMLGEKHTIKDYKGNAASNNLTISGDGNVIEQFAGGTAGTLILNSNYAKVTLEWNQTNWSIM